MYMLSTLGFKINCCCSCCYISNIYNSNKIEDNKLAPSQYYQVKQVLFLLVRWSYHQRVPEVKAVVILVSRLLIYCILLIWGDSKKCIYDHEKLFVQLLTPFINEKNGVWKNKRVWKFFAFGKKGGGNQTLKRKLSGGGLSPNNPPCDIKRSQ